MSNEYSALQVFRANFKKSVEQEAKDDFDGSIFTAVPPNVHELFAQFLDEGATREDILNLLHILCNEDSHDWDSIAHNFL